MTNHNKTKATLSIGEAAQIIGVSVDTLRNWDASGDFVAMRTAGNTRRYSTRAVYSRARARQSQGKETGLAPQVYKMPEGGAFIVPPVENLGISTAQIGLIAYFQEAKKKLISKISKIKFIQTQKGQYVAAGALSVFTMAIILGTISLLFSGTGNGEILTKGSAGQQFLGASTSVSELQRRIMNLEAKVNAPIIIDSSNLQSLAITGVNILRNSSFESANGVAPRLWHYQLESDTSNTSRTKEGIHSGVYGLKIVGGGDGRYGVSQPTVKTRPGSTYTFSAFIKNTNVTRPATVKIGFWDEYGNKRGEQVAYQINGTQDWYRIHMTATTPGLITDVVSWFPMIEVEGLYDGQLYIDDAMLSESPVLTDYDSSISDWDGSSSGLGDGSVLADPDGNLFPALDSKGSLGKPNNRWEALFLTNATIDPDGNLDLEGGVTVKSGASFGGDVNLENDLTVKGDLTIGDTEGDTVAVNSADWTFANDTNFTLLGGVNGLSFDTSTLSIDAANNRVGFGTTAPLAQIHVGAGGTPSLIDGTNDLYVQDDIEIGGDLYISGGSTTTATSTSYDLVVQDSTTLGTGSGPAGWLNNLAIRLGTGNLDLTYDDDTSAKNILDFDNSTDAISMGNAAATLALSSSDWNITVDGVMTGIDSITSDAGEPLGLTGQTGINGTATAGNVSFLATAGNFTINTDDVVVDADGNITLKPYADFVISDGTNNDFTVGTNGLVSILSSIASRTPTRATAEGDLFIENILETAGAAYFDGTVEINSTLTLANDETITNASDGNIVFTDSATSQTLTFDLNGANITLSPSTGLVIDSGGSLVVQDATTINGNLDATSGIDVTGANLTVGGSSFAVNVANGNTTSTGVLNFTGAGNNLFAGNVGIGTTNPLTTLHISATDGIIIPVGTTAQRPGAGNLTTGIVRYNTTTSTFEGYDGSYWGSLGGVIDTDRDTYIRAEDSAGADNDQLRFYTAGLERMVIDANGNVGIGTTNPTSMLSVGASSQFQVNSTGNIVKINNVTTSFPSSQGAANSILQNNGSGTLTWVDPTSTGSLGYWSRTANYLTPVTSSDNLYLNTGKVGVGYDPSTISGGVAAFNGNVGIGTTGPDSRLQIVGGDLNIGGSSDTARALVVRGNLTNNTRVRLGSSSDNGQVRVFNTSNSETVHLSSSGNSYLNGGNVGIGTTGPGALLHVNGSGGFKQTYYSSSNVMTRFERDGSNFFELQHSSSLAGLGSSGGFRFITGATGDIGSAIGGTEVLRISTAGGLSLGNGYIGTDPGAGSMIIEGNVGIGTTAPGALLDVYSSANGRTAIRVRSNYAGTSAEGAIQVLSDTSSGFLSAYSSSYTGVASWADSVVLGSDSGASNLIIRNGNTTSGNIIFQQGTDEKVRITKDGNVGIGTTSPGQKLDVVGNIKANGGLLITTGGSLTSFYSGQIQSGTSSIGSGGAIGYGSSQTVLWAGSGMPLVFGTNGSEYMRLSSTGGLSLGSSYVATNPGAGSMIIEGNVGIGTTSPAAKLEVAGTSWLRGGTTTTGLFVDGSGNVGIGLTNPAVALEIGGSGNLRIGGLTASMGVYTDANKQLTSTPPTTGTLGYWQRNGTYVSPASIGDYVGIGTTAPGTSLVVVPDIAGGGITVRESDGGNDAVRLAGNASKGYIQLLSSNTSQVLLNSSGDTYLNGGNVGIGTTSPEAKLDVRDGNIVLSDDDVAHGITGTTATNNFGQLSPISGTDGGLAVWGLSDGDARGLNLYGIIGNSNPTDTVAAAKIIGGKANGTAIQALAAAETVLQVNNYGTDLVTVLGSGNVGIGTTGPEGGLHVVKGASGAESKFYFQNGTTAANGSATIGLYPNSVTNRGAEIQALAVSPNITDLIFRTNSSGAAPTDKMIITSSGNVGIGTTAPGTRLEVAGGEYVASKGQLYVNAKAGHAGYISIDSDADQNAGFMINRDGAYKTLIRRPASTSDLQILVNSYDVFYAKSNGNVGIGTTAPGTTLDVQSTGATLFNLKNTTANISFNHQLGTGLAGGTGYFILNQGSATNFGIRTSASTGNPDFYINTSGNVGIGTTAPSASLDVVSAATTGNAIEFNANAITTGRGLYVSSTSGSFSSGNMMDVYWNPTTTTTATGNLVNIGVGSSANIGKLLNIHDNGTSVFSVSETQINSAVPHSFSATGDVDIGSNINLSNATASEIYSSGALTITSGDSYDNHDLTLNATGTGGVVIGSGSDLELYSGKKLTLDVDDSGDSYFAHDSTNNRVSMWIDGTEQLRINASGESLETNNDIDIAADFDIAETYPSQDQAAEAGHIMSAANGDGDTYFVQRASYASEDRLIGVYSANPGLTLGKGSFRDQMCEDVKAGDVQKVINEKLLIAMRQAGKKELTEEAKDEIAKLSQILADIEKNPSSEASPSAEIATNVATESAVLGEATPSATLSSRATPVLSEVEGVEGSVASDSAEIDSSASVGMTGEGTVGMTGEGTVGMTGEGSVASESATLTDIRDSRSLVAGYIKDEIDALKSVDDAEAIALSVYDSVTACQASREVPIALAGRVPVKVDDSSGQIKPGDYITISTENEGYGAKAVRQGWVIGKALTGFSDAGRGQIMVFVQNSWYPGPNSSQLAANNSASTTLGLQDAISSHLASLTISEDANLNDVFIAGTLTSGVISIKDNQIESLSLSEPLEINPSALSDIEFEGGLITMTTGGSLHVTGTITAKRVETEEFAVLGAKNAGKATILAGEKEVFIPVTSIKKTARVFVTPDTPVSYGVSVKEGEGFTIKLRYSEITDIAVDWFVVESEAK